MSHVSFKRGKVENLNNLTKVDGQLSITTDEGRLYYDYLDDGELKRKALYPGVLKIGEHEFNGTQDVTIPPYDGEVNN